MGNPTYFRRDVFSTDIFSTGHIFDGTHFRWTLFRPINKVDIFRPVIKWDLFSTNKVDLWSCGSLLVKDGWIVAMDVVHNILVCFKPKGSSLGPNNKSSSPFTKELHVGTRVSVSKLTANGRHCSSCRGGYADVAANRVRFLKSCNISKDNHRWEVVVAQLVERLLSIPEVRGSTPVIGKIYWAFVYYQLYWKDENK